MRNCIPDELLNLVPYPDWGETPVGIDGIVQEMLYKIPLCEELLIRKEAWHTVCDFCQRLGALLEKSISDTQRVTISPEYGAFMRVVGAGSVLNGVDRPTANFTIDADRGHVSIGDAGGDSYYVVFSVRPRFDDTSAVGGKWTPKLPAYFVEKYGECVMHGALMRIFAMGRKWQDFGLARMHGVAYNNDLNRLSFGLITSGMRKHLLIDVEDAIVQAQAENGNG